MRLLLVAFLLLTSAFAFSDPKDLVTLEGTMRLTGAASTAGSIDFVETISYYIVQTDNRQTGQCPVPTTSGKFGNLYTSFNWTSPPFYYNYLCDFRATPFSTLVISPSPFPIRKLPPETIQFVTPSDFVVITPEIERLATSLASGSNDTFEVASRLASWVHNNIVYNKDFFKGAASSTAVFASRTGACDEMAHLLLALARSLRIPGRYVGGYAYGGSGREAAFGPHGWAELYIPDAGWVPFDPTFGEYGWVDPSHLKFYSALDANFTIQQTKMTYAAEPPTLEWNNSEPLVELTKEQSGFTEAAIVSFNLTPSLALASDVILVQAVLRNPNPSAVFLPVDLIYRPSNLPDGIQTIVFPAAQNLLLYPGERKTLSWLLQPQVGGYLYPISLVAGQSTASTNLTVTKSSGSALTIEATPNKNRYSQGDSATLFVKIRSLTLSGQAVLHELSSGASISYSLAPTQTTTLSLTVPANKTLLLFSEGVLLPVSLEISPSKFQADLDAPAAALENSPFSAFVSVSGTGPTTITLADQTKTLDAPTIAAFNLSLASSTTLTAAVSQAGDSLTLSQRVSVVPRPLFSWQLPKRIFAEETELTPLVWKNANLTDLAFALDGSYLGSTKVRFTPTCSPQTLSAEIVYTDLTGGPHSETLQTTFTPICGPWVLLGKLLNLLGL